MTDQITGAAARAKPTELSLKRKGERIVAEMLRSAAFVVVEGLSGVGKSTTAPLLAEALGATYVDTLIHEFEPVRRKVDAGDSVAARMHFWMMANYAISDVVRKMLATGESVVIESYFYRTVATHGAMGASLLPGIDWDHAVQPDLAVLLTIDEVERLKRLRERDGATFHNNWHRLGFENADAAQKLYGTFDLTSLDITGLTPNEVVSNIMRLLRERVHVA